jgi:PhnB protein
MRRGVDPAIARSSCRHAVDPFDHRTPADEEIPMRLIPYLNFDGDCRKAFEFYAEALGGRLIGPPMTCGESPMAAQCPEAVHDRVMHVQLEADGATLMGADGPAEFARRESATCINVDVGSIKDAERIFATLSAGGRVDVPIAETFWALRWGSLTDRYGKPWMVNCMKPMV